MGEGDLISEMLVLVGWAGVVGWGGGGKWRERKQMRS